MTVDSAIESAREKLTAAGVFFGCMDDDDGPGWEQTLNLNDAMHWAFADHMYVQDEDLPEVWRLFFDYGWNGILYWVCSRRGENPTFEVVKRGIQFVAREEEIRAANDSSSKRAYAVASYVVDGKASGVNIPDEVRHDFLRADE